MLSGYSGCLNGLLREGDSLSLFMRICMQLLQYLKCPLLKFLCSVVVMLFLRRVQLGNSVVNTSSKLHLFAKGHIRFAHYVFLFCMSPSRVKSFELEPCFFVSHQTSV